MTSSRPPLTSRTLTRAGREAEPAEDVVGAGAARGAVVLAEVERQQDVLAGGQRVEEVVRLEDEADAPAHADALGRAQPVQLGPQGSEKSLAPNPPLVPLDGRDDPAS